MDDPAAWYVVHLSGRSDASVKFWLGKMALQFYYPSIRELIPLPRNRMSHSQRAAGVKVWRPRVLPMFPRYMFVRFRFMTDRWREIFDIAGISGMICEAGLPVRVDDRLIDRLRSREVEGAIPGTTSALLLFSPGDTVRVIRGPLTGQNATVVAIPNLPIEEVDTNTRLRITVDWFGRATPVDIHPDHLSAARAKM